MALDNEHPAAFDALLQGLMADFKPQGTSETLIVQRMARWAWKQQRLEELEHHRLAHAAQSRVTPADIFKKMNLPAVPEKAVELFDVFDTGHGLDDDAALEEVNELLVECEDFERLPGLLLDPARGPTAFPRLWTRVVPPDWQENPEWMHRPDRSGDQPAPEILQKVRTLVELTRQHFEAVAFLVRNRDGIHKARAAVRADNVAAAWHLDQSHRHHTQLEERFDHALEILHQLQQRRPPPKPGAVSG
ncbi:hypothetical protein [Hydrogenophaga sp.]|uniref:hypothetical protein n=1 Tax=Hydrogenophaga sp. TaxID=1904254 RepID=UPI00286D989D|nr:hypothetical protein [Hydrogenophaga sp.]